jgi:hypothetical protein
VWRGGKEEVERRERGRGAEREGRQRGGAGDRGEREKRKGKKEGGRKPLLASLSLEFIQTPVTQLYERHFKTRVHDSCVTQL